MNIKDRIYGTITIEDPLILQLINTTPFQRLKRINQYGGVNLVYPDKYQISRYEHSIGVWYILKTLHASLEVQIAGLLHDIGHTAFSHMVDHAMENEEENFHEHNLDLIEGFDEIQTILRQNNIHLKPVDEYSEIKLSMPYIGADRLDYGLRDYIGATNERTNLGKRILNDITLWNKQIVFNTESIANEFAHIGLKAMWLVIYDPVVAVVYSSLSEILRKGLKQKWITHKDLYKDDSYVMDIIKKHADKLPSKYLKIFTTPFTIHNGNKNKYDFIHKKLKIRYFDPLVYTDNNLQSLSSLDSFFEQGLKSSIQLFNSTKQGKYFCVTFKSNSSTNHT